MNFNRLIPGLMSGLLLVSLLAGPSPYFTLAYMPADALKVTGTFVVPRR